MRQGAAVLTLFLTAAIVGCGGTGYKKSSTNSANLSLAGASSIAAGNSVSAGSSNAASGTTATTSSPASGSNSGTTAGGGGSSNPSSPPAPTSGTAVAITVPGDGATVSSPAQVSTSVTGSAAVSSTQLYVDNAMSFQVAAPQINTALTLPQGVHMLVAQVWDQNGNSYSSAGTYNGSGSGPRSACSSSARPAGPTRSTSSTCT